MQVVVWLLWALCLHTWAEVCQGKDHCPPEQGADKRSKTRVREHLRHALRLPHAAHRGRPHHRKGSRVHAEETPPRIVHHPSDVVVKVGNPATLSCRADGNPKPSIEWLHDGQPLEQSGGEDQQQAIVLPEGSLFFLNAGGAKRGQSHEGIYTCRARNSAGIATSRNASLYIAALQEEFVVEPSDVEVAEGEVAVLNCGPPVGHPEPNVAWRKDGTPINSSDLHYTELSGKLIIAPAEKNHSGAYVCVASNTVGVRESRAARLTVLAKPVLVLKPENVSVKTGESAQFYCQARGDPPPAVVWSRQQGVLPNGRYLVAPDQTLQIHYVTLQDAGSYTCTAANDVGVVTASAQLLVQEVAVSKQKDLHKELSALRVALENVTIAAPGSNMSQVQWRLQSLQAQPHYLDGFEVLYRSLLPSSSDWAAKRVALPAFQTQVGPLKRGYKYEFKVRPFGSSLYGRESNTRHLRVPETVPGASPVAVSITVRHDQNDSIHLSWEPPPHETHNGVIQGYQVWCVDSSEQQYHNWTVESSQLSLDIASLQPGRRYWITIAAVNGAGVGRQSDPHGFLINPQTGSSSEPEPPGPDPPSVLTLLQDPVLIGSVGALLWCVLMAATVFLCRRHSRMAHLIPGHDRAKGLRRLVSEDLIIKHRMAAPDSPWISGAWRPAFNHKYQDLWAHKHPGSRSASFPISVKKDSSCLDSAVPMVTDNCGVYGTFYMDLTENGLKSFNSPGRRPRMAHAPPFQNGAETIQIFSQPLACTPPLGHREALPWKQAIRPQPRMGVLRESWEKNHSKQELHAVRSVPLEPSGSRPSPPALYTQRLSQAVECSKASPRLLHYSASLQLVDMLPPPPPPADTHSMTSDEGSSRSTKLTVDLASLPSLSASSGFCAAPGGAGSTHSGPSTASRLRSLDDDDGSTLTTQEATQYLELCPKPERCTVLPEQPPSLLHSFVPSMGFLREPPRTAAPERGPAPEELEAPPLVRRGARLQSTPSSCCSEWDGSLWNTWSSLTDGDLASARTSLISSVDSCYTTDSATFAHLLATAAATGTLGAASLSDLSPPASPLGPPWPGVTEGRSWDWSLAWLEEMGAQYRAHYPPSNSRPFNM